ncbi:MAG: sensor protein [Bacteroidetes bacterium]|jgi:signal transduction histidine kinase|nr:sensor protein [Bacteroidota bacterium]
MPESLIAKETDPELNRKSFILIKTIWSVLIILSLTFVINIFVQTENILRYSLILLLLWSVSMPLLYLIKKGYVYRSALVYIFFLLAMIFAFSWTGGGIKGHGIKILPIVVLFAGLTMGKKEIWFCGVIAALGGLALVLADRFHLLPVTEPLGESSIVHWIDVFTCVFLLCYLENLSVERLREALAKSQKELAMRERSEKMLAMKNEKLTEIAFLQSHQVRRPVATLLGLINLIKLEDPADPINMEVIPKIEVVTKELDLVIHDIVIKTAEAETMFKDMPT